MGSTDLIKEDLPTDVSWLDRIASSIRQVPALDLLISGAITALIASTVGLEKD